MNDDNEHHGWTSPPTAPTKRWIEYAEWFIGIWIFALFVIGFLIGKHIQ